MNSASNPWHEYKRRRMRFILAFVLGSAVVGIGFLASSLIDSSAPASLGIVVFTVGVLWSSTSLSKFPCPKCGKPFIYGDEIRNGFTRQCVHCGLPKWSIPP